MDGGEEGRGGIKGERERERERARERERQREREREREREDRASFENINQPNL